MTTGSSDIDSKDKGENEIDAVLNDMTRALKQCQNDDPDIANTSIEMIGFKAMHLDDLAQAHNYPLLVYFAQSLHKFCDHINLSKHEHQVILHAHIDAMRRIKKEDWHGDDHPETAALKTSIQTAIDQHK